MTEPGGDFASAASLRQDGPVVLTDNNSDLRAWARANGFTVADRGRIPAVVKIAWQSAQPAKPSPSRRRSTSKPAQHASTPDTLDTTERLDALEAQVHQLTSLLQNMGEQLGALGGSAMVPPRQKRARGPMPRFKDRSKK